jgi:hypothetical protein
MTSAPALVAAIVAVLMVQAGLVKRQLSWRTQRPSRRRRPRR